MFKIFAVSRILSFHPTIIANDQNYVSLTIFSILLVLVLAILDKQSLSGLQSFCLSEFFLIIFQLELRTKVVLVFDILLADIFVIAPECWKSQY